MCCNFKVIILLTVLRYFALKCFAVATDTLDLTKIVNPHNFSYITHPGVLVCSSFNSTDKNSTFILFYIHTNPSHQRNRVLIRETWGNSLIFPNIRVVFMMGQSSNQRINDLIAQENESYGDIVQENFIDTYRNLTYKAIMAVKWISKYCTHANYIVKVDDDVFVDTFKLTKHLAKYRKYGIAKNITIMFEFKTIVEEMIYGTLQTSLIMT